MSDTELDIALLSLLKSGDKRGFDTLFRKYYRPLCAYAYRFVNFEDVEEIVLDVLLWIWQNHDNLTIHTSVQAYLYRAVHLRCLSCIEQHTARERAHQRYQLELGDVIASEIDSFETHELLLNIQKAINRLPPKFREAFVMHRFQNHSYKEIAQLLDVSPKTVDYRIQQALKLLHEDLKDYFPFALLYIGIHSL
uniref:RNA polymerase sigma-70 factor n=1 Tax=Prevotella sp. GTC17253 TaxID=3236793 RepID=A0AB33INN3_9BACT